MDADDARLVRIYTAAAGTFLESTTPNAATPTAATNFDVVIEGDAGNAKGNNGQGYNLRFDTVDLTTAGFSAAFSNTITGQSFSAGSLWTQPVPGGDFRNVWQRNLTVTAAQQGHIFQCTASLVTANNDVVSFVQSEPFLIV